MQGPSGRLWLVVLVLVLCSLPGIVEPFGLIVAFGFVWEREYVKLRISGLIFP